MNFIIKSVVISLSLLLFSACESSKSATLNTKSISISGKIVDGYISGAIVCIDTNLDGQCGVGEPQGRSSSTGSFSFSGIEVDNSYFVGVIATGGTDIATDELYSGSLMNIIDTSSINTVAEVNVTPLTDLISTLFLNVTPQTSNVLELATSKIAAACSLNSLYVDKNPMSYAGVFAKSQEVEQLKKLIESSAENVSTASSSIIKKNIKKAIALGINETNSIDVPTILSQVDSLLGVTIADSEKNFIKMQWLEVQDGLDTFRVIKDLTYTNLIEYQAALERLQQSAIDSLNITPIDINVFGNDTNSTTNDTNSTTKDTNTTVLSNTGDSTTNTAVDETMTQVSFSGYAVDGYISEATVCLDENEDEICNSDESQTTTDSNGAFTFNGVEVRKSSFIPIIVSGGTDTVTQKSFVGEFKSILDVDSVTEATQLNINPLSDLGAVLYLQTKEENDVTLASSFQTIADALGVTSDELNSDPMQANTLFALSQEIQNIKMLLESVSKSVDDTNDLKNIRDTIKKVIVTQLADNASLDLEKIIVSVEVELGIAISDTQKSFIKSQMTEVRRVLGDVNVDVWVLDRLQLVMDKVLESAYSDLNFVEMNITDLSLTKSEYSKIDAIFDKQACLKNDTYNMINSYYNSSDRVEDNINGVSLYYEDDSNETNEESQVKMFYPNLDVDMVNSNSVVFKDKYNFSYDDAWLSNSNKNIYLELPQVADGPYSCYRVQLNSTDENEIAFVKVYRYSDIVFGDFVNK